MIQYEGFFPKIKHPIALKQFFTCIRVTRTTMSTMEGATPAETSRINIFKPSGVMQYLQKITQDSNATKFMRDAIDLRHDFIKGLTKEELKEMMEEEIDEPIKRELYEKVYEMEENQTTLLAATLLKGSDVRHSWVVKAVHKNGKYDLLEVHAIQKKELDKQKLLAYGFSFLHSSSGSNENASKASENCQKTSMTGQRGNVQPPHCSNDRRTMMEAFKKEKPVDVLCAYILQDLQDKNMLNPSMENNDTWE